MLSNQQTERRVLAKSLPSLAQTTAIDLDITDGCNLACSYCFKNLDTPNNMSLQTAMDSIDWLIKASGNSDAIYVNFMGGEPTLRFRDLKVIVKFGKRRAAAVGKTAHFSFTSNMTLWNTEIRQWVDQEGIGVLMSIDGHPDVQDSQRPSKNRKPMSETIAEWAKSMLKTRPNADARMTLSPDSVDRMYDSCIYLWEEIGFKSIMMADAAYEGWSKTHFNIYTQQLDKLVDYLVDDFSRKGEKRIAILSYYIKNLLLPRSVDMPPVRRNSPCGAGYNYLMIDHEGTIWPCHRFDGAAEDAGMATEFVMGNIYTQQFNEKLSHAFRTFDHSKVYKPECTTCPVEPICGGFCPAANLQHAGETDKSIYKPHFSYCQLKWILYERAKNLFKRVSVIDPDRASTFFISTGVSAGEK